MRAAERSRAATSFVAAPHHCHLPAIGHFHVECLQGTHGRPFGSARPCGRYLVASTPEGTNKVAMPAIDKIAFVFNLLLRIIGGDGFLSASRALATEHFSCRPLAKFVHQAGLST